MTGRCESFLTTGTALRSSVKRVAVSNVRIPRSQRITRGLPPERMYSAERSHSWMLVDIPRLSRTGLPASATRFRREKFCTLRAPGWRGAAVFELGWVGRGLVAQFHPPPADLLHVGFRDSRLHDDDHGFSPREAGGCSSRSDLLPSPPL